VTSKELIKENKEGGVALLDLLHVVFSFQTWMVLSQREK
jgi:hypothetical protein